LQSIWLLLYLSLCTGYCRAATVSHQTNIETAWRCKGFRKTSLRNISYKRAKAGLHFSGAVKQSHLYYLDLLLCFNTCEQVYFIAACNTVHCIKQVHRFLLQKTIPGISADGVSAMTI